MKDQKKNIDVKHTLFELLKRIQKRKTIITALACVVVFVTTYALILPALTLDKEEAAQQGGIDIQTQEEQAGSLSFTGKGYTVTADCSNADLPEGTEIAAEEITKSDAQYNDFYQAALNAVQKDGDTTVSDFEFANFYDIALFDSMGVVAPSNEVDVTISYEKTLQKKLKVTDPGKIHIIHFAEDEATGEITPEVLDNEDVEVTVDSDKLVDTSFAAEDSSVYAVTYADDAAENDSKETVNAAESEKVRRLPRPKAVKSSEGEEGLEHHKTLTPNLADNGEWDGTYTLSLDIVGKKTSSESSSVNKADIILVLDMSSSMTDNSIGGKTRFEIEQDAVSKFGYDLLANNDNNPDTVRMTVITFGNLAQGTEIDQETDKEAYKNAVDSLPAPPTGEGGPMKGGQGTNWEDALQKANSVPTRSDAEKYVIFVSDGRPTLRNTPDNPTNMDNVMYRFVGAYGPGVDTVAGWYTYLIDVNRDVRKCYDNAQDEARDLVEAGKKLYTITVFEDLAMEDGSHDNGDGWIEDPNAGFNCMESLLAYAYNDGGAYPAECYNFAADADGLSSIFSSILETASSALQYQNVKITDTLTVATKSTLQVEGHANDFKYYKNGTEWSGAPDASYNNGTVEWDLGEDPLDDNTTYTVSFTVWPNQDAYDAIMKLNNGDATEADIERDYPDVYANLKKDGDKYVIYSNGDATVSYQKATSENGGDFVLGDVETLEYPRPTMETLEYKMKVAKVWKDSLYANNRPDSITFNILEDGNQYKTVTLTKENASASDSNRWEAEIPISPGIISNKIIDGVRLNGGHEYTVVEAGNSDYHYDFDPEVLTPMLDDGTMHFLGDADGDEALSGTNHMRGSMTVTKKVINEDGEDISSDSSLADKEFTFIVYILKPVGGGAYEEITGKTADDEDAVWYKLLDDQNQEVGNASVINSGDTFTLKAGNSLRLLNLPKGYKYKIKEVTASNPEGFVFDSEEYDSVSETNDKTVELTPDNEGYCVAQPNTWQYVTVTNKKVPAGSLKITKNVTVDGKTPEGALKNLADGTYTFVVTDSDNHPAKGKVNGQELADGKVTVTISGGAAETVEVTGLAPGTYTITESAPTNGTSLTEATVTGEGTVSGSNAATVTVTAENEETVPVAAFTNNAETTEIQVEKKWLDSNGQPDNSVTHSVEFELYQILRNGNDTVDIKKYQDTEYTNTITGNGKVKITGLPKYGYLEGVGRTKYEYAVYEILSKDLLEDYTIGKGDSELVMVNTPVGDHNKETNLWVSKEWKDSDGESVSNTNDKIRFVIERTKAETNLVPVEFIDNSTQILGSQYGDRLFFVPKDSTFNVVMASRGRGYRLIANGAVKDSYQGLFPDLSAKTIPVQITGPTTIQVTGWSTIGSANPAAGVAGTDYYVGEDGLETLISSASATSDPEMFTYIMDSTGAVTSEIVGAPAGETAGSWASKFEGLPLYSSTSGTVYHYEVKEISILPDGDESKPQVVVNGETEDYTVTCESSPKTDSEKDYTEWKITNKEKAAEFSFTKEWYGSNPNPIAWPEDSQGNDIPINVTITGKKEGAADITITKQLTSASPSEDAGYSLDVSDNSYKFTFTGLEKGYDYQITEADLDGYHVEYYLKDSSEKQLSGVNWTDDGGTIKNILTIAELPSAGGPGTTWMYLLGCILLIGCGIILTARRKIGEDILRK